jgi:hypothetical protein
VTAPRKPQRYIVTDKCGANCSMNPRNNSAAEHIHRWYEEGKNLPSIITLAAGEGVKVSHGALGRHFASHVMSEAQVLEHRDRLRTAAQRGSHRGLGTDHRAGSGVHAAGGVPDHP